MVFSQAREGLKTESGREDEHSQGQKNVLTAAQSCEKPQSEGWLGGGGGREGARRGEGGCMAWMDENLKPPGEIETGRTPSWSEPLD